MHDTTHPPKSLKKRKNGREPEPVAQIDPLYGTFASNLRAARERAGFKRMGECCQRQSHARSPSDLTRDGK